MAQEDALDLMARAGVSFVGTVQGPAAPGTSDVGAAPGAVVVRVDEVLHAPDALAQLAGSDVTVQLDPAAKPLAAGAQSAFFTNALAFGDTLSVAEIGRLPVDAVAPHVSTSMAMGLSPQLGLRRQLEDRQLRSHAAETDALVVGRVVKLEKAGPTRFAEHDPDWWLATLDVRHVERGRVASGSVQVLYANSLDYRWRNSPKPKAGQDGLWLLHATEGDQRKLGRWVIPDAEDYQPVENLDRIRARG